ncbi:MAG: type II toxin-antitoxin system PemK/MazF family toxin [Clostridium sp.]|nr:type II toxin-antitoxin system PemK/MazF family toxin [Clostridium sp.]
MKIKRGDIIIVDLGQHETSVQSGIRPCVVISNNRANRHSPVITVVPLTSKIRKKQYLPTHVFLNGYRNTGMDRHGLALCEQITSVAFSDILEVAGRVSGRKLAEIGNAVKVQCGLVA